MLCRAALLIKDDWDDHSDVNLQLASVQSQVRRTQLELLKQQAPAPLKTRLVWLRQQQQTRPRPGYGLVIRPVISQAGHLLH